MSHSKADDICLTCRHFRIDHSDFVGPCDYIKWIEGHPEYRCMCRTFVKRTTQCICIDHPVYGVEVNGECPLHGNPGQRTIAMQRRKSYERDEKIGELYR